MTASTALQGEQNRLVLVTGPSGAGRSTAINALEDLGFEVIDNMPLSLVPRLLEGQTLQGGLALGIDVRTRDFSVNSMIDLIDRLTVDPSLRLDLLYLDARVDVLVRRYAETRRRHPLAAENAPLFGIRMELDLLAPVRERANLLIDTSDLSPHQLREEIAEWYQAAPTGRMSISVQSFSYRRGLPRGVDMVFDCRFLSNPHWVEALRPLDGRAPEVAAYVAGGQRYPAFFEQCRELVLSLLPAFVEEGKTHLSIAFGCTGGQHRSVVLTEKLAEALAEAGWQVSKRHRELERRATITAQTEPGA